MKRNEQVGIDEASYFKYNEFLTKKELQQLLSQLRDRLSMKAVEYLISQANVNAQGKINIDEFIAIAKGDTFDFDPINNSQEKVSPFDK